MLDHMNRKQRLDIRACLQKLIAYGLLLPALTATGFSLLVAGMAALVGLPALDAGLDFFGEATITLAGPTAHLWLIGFFATAFCFGAGRSLPVLLRHHILNADVIARFTQTIALWSPFLGGIVALLCGPGSKLSLLARPSRTALSTASDLAGSAPRLE